MPPNISTTPTLGVGTKTCLSFRSTQKCSTPTLGVDKNMFDRFHKNKCSDLAKYFSQKVWWYKETWGYQKRKRKEA